MIEINVKFDDDELGSGVRGCTPTGSGQVLSVLRAFRNFSTPTIFSLVVSTRSYAVQKWPSTCESILHTYVPFVESIASRALRSEQGDLRSSER